MDLFIWGAPFFQDTIEEDALNEKCCVQVLEILIAKADTEIAELEDDIVMLQSRLAHTDEKWLDMCIAALSKKVDRLGSLITALKHQNDQASGVQLQTNRKPSERIHEILETPLRNFSSSRAKQPANSTLGSSKLAAAVLIKVEATDDHNLKDIETVEMNGDSTVQANVTIQTPSVVQDRNYQETDEHAITKGSSTKASGHAGEKSTLKDLNEADIPGKLINASKRENPSHLNNSACAVMKSASTKPLREKAQFCGASKRKINTPEDFFDDKLMSQSSDDGIILNSSPKVKETSIGEGPKPARAIVATHLNAVKQEPKESGDEQTQNGGKAGQTREKQTSSQLVSQKRTGAKRIIGIEGGGLLTEIGHTLEDSRVALLNPQKKDSSMHLEKFKGEPQVKQSSKSQVLTIHKSNSKFSQKLEGPRLNFKWNVPTVMTKELCLAEELGVKSLSGLKLKRQLKTESTKENGGDVFGDKTIKGSLSTLGLGGAKGTGNIPEISSTSLIHLKKRRITSSTGPILQENENLRDFQNRLLKSHDRSNQNLQVIKVENDELLHYTTFVVPTPNITDLKYMTMNQLKAVAREQKLHGVYKLRKAELQECLCKLLAKGRST